MKMFQVGGCIRDEILGIPSKDIDFTVVLEPEDFADPFLRVDVEIDPFKVMEKELTKRGFKIFLSTPEFFTVRAQFPEGDGGFDVQRAGGPAKPGRKRLTADFVLARKEGTYTDGRRPDSVTIGSLEDDLARRDFTMNAIAKDDEGNLIDPFGGQRDIAMGIISAVGDAGDRFREDALRAVRALRFSVTKNMVLDPNVRFAMQNVAVLDAIENKISDERIKDELSKMFKFDTVASVLALNEFPALTRAMFTGKVSLDATMKTKGRG